VLKNPVRNHRSIAILELRVTCKIYVKRNYVHYNSTPFLAYICVILCTTADHLYILLLAFHDIFKIPSRFILDWSLDKNANVKTAKGEIMFIFTSGMIQKNLCLNFDTISISRGYVSLSNKNRLFQCPFFVGDQYGDVLLLFFFFKKQSNNPV